jgi:hypothetical protein
MLPGDVLGDAITQWLTPALHDEVVIGAFASDIDAAARWLGWLS